MYSQFAFKLEIFFPNLLHLWQICGFLLLLTNLWVGCLWTEYKLCLMYQFFTMSETIISYICSITLVCASIFFWNIQFLVFAMSSFGILQFFIKTYIFHACVSAEAILLGFQHYLVMLGTTVLIPTALVPQMGGGYVRPQRFNL